MGCAESRANRREHTDEHTGDRRVDPRTKEALPNQEPRGDVQERLTNPEPLHQENGEYPSGKDDGSRQVDASRVEQRDHDDAADVIDDGKGEEQHAQDRSSFVV